MIKKPKVSFTVTITARSYAVLEYLADEHNLMSRTKAIEFVIRQAESYERYIEVARKERLRKQGGVNDGDKHK